MYSLFGNCSWSGELNNFDVGPTAIAVICHIMETATVIREGECETVRLPKGFHLAVTTVGVRHQGETIVLEPLKPKAWPEGFFDSIHITDPAFVRPVQAPLPPVKPL